MSQVRFDEVFITCIQLTNFIVGTLSLTLTETAMTSLFLVNSKLKFQQLAVMGLFIAI